MTKSSQSTTALSTGLVLGSLLILGFYLLEYSLGLSIFFGAIGGYCGYCLVMWWHIDERIAPSDNSTFKPLQDSFKGVLLKSKLMRQPNSQQSQRPTKPFSLVEWIIRGNKTR